MKILSTGLLARRPVRLALVALVVLALLLSLRSRTPVSETPPATQGTAALSVALLAPELADWPQTLAANGNVVAWQEAVIGAEVSNVRIDQVLVQVGDTVRRGQVLARLDQAAVAADLAAAEAAVAERAAAQAEAQANALRAKELQAQGFYSQQMNTQYQTAEQSAAARLAAAQASRRTAALRLSQTEVRAPDDGVISARSATVGTLLQPGQELFRLIRGGRLEWRAEVPSADLGKLQPGQLARVTGPAGETVDGKIRSISPSVDPQTRNGLVYVDLPASTAVRAGVFARGEFALGRAPARTVPQSALVLREGFAYLFRLEGEDRVAQTKVTTGRRQGERVEIVAGLPDGARVVASGAGFLADGDRVRVVTGEAK